MCAKTKNTIITLLVDTEALIANPAKINQFVTFSDNQGEVEKDYNPDDYVSTVNVSPDATKPILCIWLGESKNKHDVINIAKVVKKSGGENILNVPIPKGKDSKSVKIGNQLSAPVSTSYMTGDEPYTVFFTINEDPRLFPVDPKIRMRPKTTT